MKRVAILVAVAVFGVAAAGYALWGRGGADDEHGYVTEAVDRGPITSVVLATGTVNPVSSVLVGTYVSGPIKEIYADFNSPVSKGQKVAKIDPATFQVKVQQAEANLVTARARVEKAKADLVLKRLTLGRNEEMRRRDLISQNDLDTAKSGYDQAVAEVGLQEAGVRQAEAQLAESRINLNFTDIVSPVDGVVVSRSVEVGQTVAASFQTPTLFEIAQDLTKMQVEASVSESDIGSVRQGQKADFGVDAFPGRRFEGLVTQVRNAPVTVSNVVTYDVVIGVDNSGLELKPGMTATVTITTAEKADALRLPVRALRFKPQPPGGEEAAATRAPDRGQSAKPVVWRLKGDGTVERVEIDTGLRDDVYAEVVAGDVAAGDPIAVAMRKKAEVPQAPRIPGMPGRMR
jgi:HlyD family secretion protein